MHDTLRCLLADIDRLQEENYALRADIQHLEELLEVYAEPLPPPDIKSIIELAMFVPQKTA